VLAGSAWLEPESLQERVEVLGTPVAVTPAQRDELDRRPGELDGGDAKTITWADAKRRLRRSRLDR